MKIRQQLSYSNVVATIALAVALGTGGAYAASEIGSSEIDNNSIRSKDLKNRKGVAGRDVKRNTLSGKEIRERTLDAGELLPLASASTGGCNPTSSTFIDCAEAPIALPEAGRLLVIANGEYFSEGGAANLECRIAIDGQNEPGAAEPGEETADNTSLTATDGFGRTRVTERLSKGGHDVALRCAQLGAEDGRLGGAQLAILGVPGS